VFKPAVKSVNKVPDELLHDVNLKSAMNNLPENYNFEIPKTIWRIRQTGAKRVTLQIPEAQ
jgi:2-(3-amino-3-carboxypropyl)histidine synthase